MKYIDAEKLKVEIEGIIKKIPLNYIESGSHPSTEKINNKLREGIENCLKSIKERITSLQQEQPKVDFPTTDEEVREFLKSCPNFEVPEKYKTTDWLFNKNEKPGVDLERELDKYFDNGMALQMDWTKCKISFTAEQLRKFARHFYELGLKAGKEKSQ